MHYHKGIVQANEDDRPTSIVESNIPCVPNRTGKSFKIETPQLFPLIYFSNDVLLNHM